MLSGDSVPERVCGQPGPGPKPGAKPAPFGEGCGPRHFSANRVPCNGRVTLSLSCRFRCLYFCGMQSKGSCGTRESPLPSAGASAAAAWRWEPSFLPAKELSAGFQSCLILSNLWVSMKSFQFDTQSVQRGSQSCAIPSSLFWNLVCIFFWYERKPDVSIPQRKLWPAHG